MATKIQVRRDTAANWTSVDTVLSEGEIGYEIDTGYMKIGDGTTAWTSLSYFTPNPVDDNTTYTYSVAQAGSDATMTLAGTDATNDVVTLIAGTQLTLTVAGDNVTVDVDPDLANYSNATSAFISDITAEAIGSLSDVDVSAVADGSILAYDQASGNWVAGAAAINTLGDLSDVNAAGPSQGDILTYQSGSWVNSFQFYSTMEFLAPAYMRQSISYTASGQGEYLGLTDGDTITLRDGPYGGDNSGAGIYFIERADANFVADITDQDVNLNRYLERKIIVNNNYIESPSPGDIIITGRKSDPSFDFPRRYILRTGDGSEYTYDATNVGDANYFTGIAALAIPGLSITSGADDPYFTNPVRLIYTPQYVGDTLELVEPADIVATPSGWDHFAMTERIYSIADNDTGGYASPGVVMTGIKFNGTAVDIDWVGGEAPIGGTGRYDIYDIGFYYDNSNYGRKCFIKHSTTNSLSAQVLNGDLTGSVFGDDSTLLVDGVNNTIPAVNLSGALPAIDGSNLLNIGVGDNITAVVDDTTPQLGGNLDLNSADVTGTGNIDITGNITNTGDTTVTGTLKVDSGNNIVIEKTVSGNNETFGNIIATTGTTEYAKIEFKTGADGFADNSEINWFSRVGGSSVQIFEIKGSTLGKSGFEINPSANLNVDFFMQGASDPTLIFADSGLDKVGFGKIPTQGKVDVDGDIYATTIRGTIVAEAGTAPTAGSDPGDEGEIRFDNDYIYVKTPGGSWKRTALSTII